jgi:hypothetical protein
MIWGGFDVVLLDYNNQQGRCTLATVTLAPICCYSCRAKNNFEPANNRRTSKNKWTSKQRIDHPRVEIWNHEFGVLDTSSRVVWIDTHIARK